MALTLNFTANKIDLYLFSFIKILKLKNLQLNPYSHKKLLPQLMQSGDDLLFKTMTSYQQSPIATHSSIFRQMRAHLIGSPLLRQNTRAISFRSISTDQIVSSR